jgi:hypothetical protein
MDVLSYVTPRLNGNVTDWHPPSSAGPEILHGESERKCVQKEDQEQDCTGHSLVAN